MDGWSISPSHHAKIGKRDTPGVTNTAPLKCLDARVQRVIASLPVARGESQTVNMRATGSENIRVGVRGGFCTVVEFFFQIGFLVRLGS